MRIALAGLLVAIGTTGASAGALPRYDVEAYCKQVSDISGGSSMIYNGCMEMEQQAYDKLKADLTSIPEKTQTYCNNVAQVSGGSYAIFGGCVDMETEASSNTPEFQF